MRIVHEIDGEATTSICAEPYAKARTQSTSSGFKVEACVIVEECGFVSSEELHIEGNARYILRALCELVDQIETVGDDYVERGLIRADWREDPRS